MRAVFADTGYWIALLNKQDDLHEKAKKLSKSIQPVHIVTSDMVLTEVLNDFSSRGDRLRASAIALAKDLQQSPNATVISTTDELFEAGLKLYECRPDKNWSQTDCVSFIIMKRKNISQALAYDKHFIQAGFSALMQD
ncbi:MAG: PIN domain-containing protein [Cyanobacteria bacterium J06649_4]